MMSDKPTHFLILTHGQLKLNYWGWLLLMKGTPAVDMVKKIPLFTTGETYMSGGVLSSPDFWLPSTVVAFIGKNIGTWNPQSPPKLKVDGNGEINNHFPCKSSSNWSFANWNWFFFWYQEAARDRWQLKYVGLFLKCSFFGVSWSNLTSICFRLVGEKPPIRKIKFLFLSHGPLA